MTFQLTAKERTEPGSDILRSAHLSSCGTYRYSLTRAWGGARLTQLADFATFVMLNPSTADASIDDPTIRKCMAYARKWGKRGIHVVNLYAFRATSPRALKVAGYPVGEANEEAHLRAFRYGNPNVICAWGAHAQPEAAALCIQRIKEMGALAYALRINKDGGPAHPLYLPGDLSPSLYGQPPGDRRPDVTIAQVHETELMHHQAETLRKWMPGKASQ